MNKTYCVGCKHFSENINEIVNEKLNPKTNNRVEIFRGKCFLGGRSQSQNFSEQTTKGRFFEKRVKCKLGNCFFVKLSIVWINF